MLSACCRNSSHQQFGVGIFFILALLRTVSLRNSRRSYEPHGQMISANSAHAEQLQGTSLLDVCLIVIVVTARGGYVHMLVCSSKTKIDMSLLQEQI